MSVHSVNKLLNETLDHQVMTTSDRKLQLAGCALKLASWIPVN